MVIIPIPLLDHVGNNNLPISALEAGADACVQGTHKMLTSFTQASMLHVKGEQLNRQRLEASLQLLQSTSTSYLLLASLDGARAKWPVTAGSWRKTSWNCPGS
ncbi:MAG: hypothetical protein ACOY3U_00030 [Bacillota bacterium]|uniref:hypothetical protein n=1 Tax=Desulforamulus profundi TaxID=1383067 RepID=UPI001EE4FE7A|nr:hypothetical protein [Desulforamulus profundi]